MSAEQLIALERAVADLSVLYDGARGFTALHARAEAELLPAVTALGSALRGLLRGARLTDERIDDTTREILALAAQWQREMDQLRSSPLLQRAAAAWRGDRQPELAELLPRVFFGLRIVRPAPALYFPVSVSTGRRRPGSSPFLSAAACAEQLVETMATGITPDPGEDWWERDLPAITCADDPAALESPLTLRLAAADVRVSVFASAGAPTLRVFTPRLVAPLSVSLAAEAADEWWEAYEESYRSFRDHVVRELASRGQTALIVDS